jgi:glutamate-1-semialdehyde 2,1-aminomutase
MNPENESIINKIRNLFKMADPANGASQNETEIAMRKAKELMTRHGIEQMHIEDKPAEAFQQETINTGRRRRDEDRWIPTVIHQVFEVKVLFTQAWDSAKHTYRHAYLFVGEPVDVLETSRVAEFNDLAALEEELKHGDVAAVLIEPALTNIGIVLPEPGYHDGVRQITRKYGALLIVDETHTFSAGYGGATRAWNLEPDIVVIGKAIGGGIPTGAYGLSAEFAAQALDRDDLDLIDMGGVGGTLAGNPLSVAAMRATLEHVLTEEAFDGMIATCTLFVDGMNVLFEKYELPWSIAQLGARCEYRFATPYPRNGGESNAAADGDLEDFLHLYLANRGIMLTPFHNMALMCPTTTVEDVAVHHLMFERAIKELLGHEV